MLFLHYYGIARGLHVTSTYHPEGYKVTAINTYVLTSQCVRERDPATPMNTKLRETVTWSSQGRMQVSLFNYAGDWDLASKFKVLCQCKPVHLGCLVSSKGKMIHFPLQWEITELNLHKTSYSLHYNYSYSIIQSVKAPKGGHSDSKTTIFCLEHSVNVSKPRISPIFWNYW